MWTNFFSNLNLQEGDHVALFMNNCMEYAGVWLGLNKIGLVTALINYNLKMDTLGHSIRIADAKCLIVGGDLQTALEDAINNGYVTKQLPVFVFGGDDVAGSFQKLGAKNLVVEMNKSSRLSPAVNLRTNMRSPLVYIYTSGTTGLPKAAKITNTRYYFMSRGTHVAFGISSQDRNYITMPMYHSAAGILGVGQTLLSGCTSVIRKRFSASRFWDEAVQYECTMAQYIGEICRYLLAQPERDSEGKHKIRLMFGNGLRPQIWDQFVNRFGIRKIGEFYGSTEGNSNILNLNNYSGACGFFPIYTFLHPLYPVALIKVDENNQIVRDTKGLCVRCKPGESGEMVGKIVKDDPLIDFHGYADEQETKKKILQNVFSHGDSAFSSGDILHMDKRGYLFFKDRTGDTFRWKGENVATAEVEAVIHKLVGMSDGTVYGVDIPGTDGKAGMAAIVDKNANTNLVELGEKLKEKLPPYARPVFIRLCKEVDMTGTYKLKKTELQKATFDPSKCNGDKLYFLNGKTGHYEPVTPEIFQDILAGIIRF